jgi:large subunit ribosomal protein L18
MIKKKYANEARLRRHQRVRKKVSGTSVRPRLSVFRSSDHIYVQVIDDERGTTLVAASSRDPELAALTQAEGAAVGKRSAKSESKTAAKATRGAETTGEARTKGKGKATAEPTETPAAAESGPSDDAAIPGALAAIAANRRVAQARLVGKLIARRAKASGIEKVVFDRGGYLYHGRVAAVATGAREGGLDF